MTNIFIIHGKENTPEGNWFPWIAAEMEKLGHRVFVPKFPTPEGQNLDEWLAAFSEYEEFLTPDSVVVGHSLGVPFLLRLLEKHSALAAFFVAGFIDNPIDPTVETFCGQFDFEKIRANCPAFYIFCSDNDPYFAPAKGEALVKDLAAERIFVKGAGHFNLKSGYDKFPLLVEKIKSVCG